MRLIIVRSLVRIQARAHKFNGSIPGAPTVLDFPASQEWRSPRPPPRRALQSPVYIRKKAADYLKSSPSRLFWRRMIILRKKSARTNHFLKEMISKEKTQKF